MKVQSDDFVKRIEARMQRMDQEAEELTKKLGLPMDDRYEMLAIAHNPALCLPGRKAAVKKLYNSFLLVSIALLIGLLAYWAGLFIRRLPSMNTTIAVAIVLALAEIIGLFSFLAVLWVSHLRRKDISKLFRSEHFPFVSRKERDQPKPVLSLRWREIGTLFTVIFILIALVTSSFSFLFNPPGVLGNAPTGVGYGTVAFDVNRPDGDLKRQAASKLMAGDVNGAEALWETAILREPNDAEAHIYLENLRVLASHDSYFTLVVGTILTKDWVGDGRFNLQGAYIAQKEFNDRALQPGGGGILLRLLVAATSLDSTNVTTVAQQIVQLSHKDRTLVGIMGWPTSATVLSAIKVFTDAHLPMVSPTASSDDLTGISPYFFRIAAADELQGLIGTKYVEHTLHATQVAVFVDPANSYSRSLADAFIRKFTADGHTIIKEVYTVGLPETIPTRVLDALRARTTAFYFAGYASDVNKLLVSLPTCKQSSCIQVVGGDGLYVMEDYAKASYASFPRIHFTAFASPDQWKLQGLPDPPFFQEYTQTFFPKGYRSADTVGDSLPDANAILAYDAMQALLQAGRSASTPGKVPFTSDDLRQALASINGSHAIHGVSGPIAFGANGNDVEKDVMVLRLDTHGSAHLENRQDYLQQSS